MELKIKWPRGSAVINMDEFSPATKKNIDRLQKNFLILDETDHKDEILRYLEEQIWRVQLHAKDLAQHLEQKKFDKEIRRLERLRMNHDYIGRW